MAQVPPAGPSHPMGPHTPVPWSLNRTVAVRPSPLGASVCVLTESQPLQEPQGSASLSQAPSPASHPPGVRVLAAPSLFPDQTRVSEAECEGCAFPDEAGNEAVLACERHRPPAPPHVNPGSLTMSLTGNDPPSHTHTHTHTHTYMEYLQYYMECIHYLSFHRREMREPSFREAQFLLRTRNQWQTLGLFTQHQRSFH